MRKLASERDSERETLEKRERGETEKEREREGGGGREILSLFYELR